MKNRAQTLSAIIDLWLASTAVTKKVDMNLGAIHGIGFTEFVVLRHLMNAQNKIMRRVDLAESVGRTASAITKMLTPMEKIGLIQKQANPRDARESLVKITKTGEQIFVDASETLEQKSKLLLKRLDDKQVKNLVELLNLVHEG